MFNTKRYINLYTPLDGDAITKRLEKYAKRGWQVRHYGDFIVTLEKDEPKDTKYAVTFFPDATQFDPAMPPSQETYLDMCESAGWRLIKAQGPMHIFRNDRTDPIPIDTDEKYKLDGIHRSMKKTYLSGNFLLMISMLLNLINRGMDFSHIPFTILSDSSSLLLGLSILLLFIYNLFEIVHYFIWYFLSKRSIAKGGRCMPSLTGIKSFLLFSAIMLLATVLLYDIVYAPNREAGMFYAFVLLSVIALLALVTLTQKIAKKLYTDAKKVRTASVAASLALALLYCLFLLSYTSDHDIDFSRTTELSLEDSPLRLEDIGIERKNIPNISYYPYYEYRSSFAADLYSFYEFTNGGDDYVRYKVLIYDFPFVGRLALNKILDTYSWFNDVDETVWGSERAVRARIYSGGDYQYLLLYADRLIQVELPFEPSEDQAAIIAEKLTSLGG